MYTEALMHCLRAFRYLIDASFPSEALALWNEAQKMFNRSLWHGGSLEHLLLYKLTINQ